MTLENKKLTTVTNVTIQRKRLRELYNFFSTIGNKENTIVSIKPAELKEYEVFILLTKNLTLDSVFGLNDLGFSIVSIRRLESGLYQIMVNKSAEKEKNGYSRNKIRQYDISRIFETYEPLFRKEYMESLESEDFKDKNCMFVL